MSLRGAAAIVGVCELKPERSRPDRDVASLLAEASFGAIRDAGLRKEDIDGMLMEPDFSGHAGGLNAKMAEYMGIQPQFGAGLNVQGASAVTGAVLAAAIVNAGLATFVLVACAEARDPNARFEGFPPPDPTLGEWQNPWGPVVAANGHYAMIAHRYEYLYGADVAKRAKIAVDQRTNACANPNAVFYDTPMTTEDVVNSRLVADPLHLLECVMPTSGGSAFIVGPADRARSMPHKPVYILGGATHIPRQHFMHMSDFAVAPVERASKRAMAMAGYGPSDMDLLQLYDSYTITVMLELEDSGFCPKGEAGDWIQEQDFTYRGNLPLNTHGGQMSYGQAGDAGGFSQVTEAVFQARGDAGERQVQKDINLIYVTGSGGSFAQQAGMVLSTDPTA